MRPIFNEHGDPLTTYFWSKDNFCERLPGEPRILRKKQESLGESFKREPGEKKRGSSSINLRLNCIHKRKPRWEKEGVRAISRNGESPGTKMEQEKLEVGLFRENATVVRGRGRTSPSLGWKARLWELGSQQMSLKPGLFRVYNYQNMSHSKEDWASEWNFSMAGNYIVLARWAAAELQQCCTCLIAKKLWIGIPLGAVLFLSYFTLADP